MTPASKIEGLALPYIDATGLTYMDMAHYRTTFNPATGEHIQYTVTGLESNGTLVRYRWTCDPGGRIVDHTHPNCAEIFTVLDGEATFVVNKEKIILGPGQSVVIPPGAVHSELNDSGQLVRGIVELQPARQTAELHDALAGISSTLPHTPAGAPKNLLQLGATFWAFRKEIRATTPPIWLQNIFLPVLATAAKVGGVKPNRVEWSSRLPSGSSSPEILFDESQYEIQLARAGYTFDIGSSKPLPIA